MNAPINAALLAARAVNATPVPSLQPTVPSGLALLFAGYRFKELHLDLYGHADQDDGCTVEAVALTGTTVNLVCLFSLAQMAVMGWAVDRAGVEARAASRNEGRAERAAWDRAATA
jgi:hypothetical protein